MNYCGDGNKSMTWGGSKTLVTWQQKVCSGSVRNGKRARARGKFDLNVLLIAVT